MYSVILRDAGVSGNDAGACCVAACPATGLIATSPPSSVSASASAHPPLLHLLHPHPPGWSTAVPLLPFSHAPLVALRWTPPQCGRRALVAVTADGTVAVVTGGAGGSACGVDSSGGSAVVRRGNAMLGPVVGVEILAGETGEGAQGRPLTVFLSNPILPTSLLAFPTPLTPLSRPQPRPGGLCPRLRRCQPQLRWRQAARLARRPSLQRPGPPSASSPQQPLSLQPLLPAWASVAGAAPTPRRGSSSGA